MNALLNILHPLTIQLSFACFTLSFFNMYYWLVRGLRSGIFDNHVRDIGHLATQLGIVLLVLAMLAGLHDVFLGPQHLARMALAAGPQHLARMAVGPHHLARLVALKRFIDLNLALSTLALITYAAFLRLSARRRKYLQEDGRLLLGCLATQTLGYILVGTLTFVGTMLAYHPGFFLGHGG
jgi:uncharacterized membrane protein